MSEIWDRRGPEVPSRIKATEQPLSERRSPGETDGHKPAKYFHLLHFQWPAALPATAGNRLAALPMLRWNWKNPATPQPRLSVSAIRPPANHRREILECKSPHGRPQRASNGQRKCEAPQPSARAPRFCTLRPPRKTSFWLVFIGVHRRSSAANMGFGFRVGPEKKHIGPPRCCHPVAQVALPQSPVLCCAPAHAGAIHIVSTLVLSTCWASFVQNQPRNPTHKSAQKSTIPPNPAQPAIHRGWIRNFYPIGGQKVRMSLPQGRRVTRVEPARRNEHPVYRSCRHNRVHNPEGLGLRNRGAIFGVKMPLRASYPVWRLIRSYDRRARP